MFRFRFSAFAVIVFIFLTSFLGCAGPIKSERLGTLLELKKEDGLLSEHLEQEAESFDVLLEAIRKKEIKKGDLKNAVAIKAGEPVVVYSEKESEKWVYKETGSGWFKGAKIYLFFNPAGELLNYQCLRVDCRS